MAARLMMEFPNAVTCDEVTKHKSKLPEEDFEVQPPVTLKGIASPGEVYTFSTEKYVSIMPCQLEKPNTIQQSLFLKLFILTGEI